MQAVVNVVIPVFAIVLAGYLCGRFKLLGQGGSEALNGFVYYAALPALFFGSLAKVELDEILNWPYLGAFLLSMAVTGIAAFVVGRFIFGARGAALAVQNMAGLFSNTGYMGIPLAITAFGQSAALPAILATVVNGALIMGLYILWIEAERSEGSHLLHVARDALAGVFRSPLVLSAIAGILSSALQLEVPKPLLTFCDIIGAAAPPAALFAMGLFMVGKSFKGDLTEVGVLSALKLILHPLATFAIVLWLVDLAPLWRDVLLLMAALPTGSLVFVLAAQQQVYVRRATGIILGSTLASVVTLSWLLDYLNVG
ncbi:MAG: AEC family transporter [Rhodospirillaceae bacterium]|jgi:predicted permease|nr:AEC family transporter [Rhodospirillaceae bacterium]